MVSCQWFQYGNKKALRPGIENAYFLVRSPGGPIQVKKAALECNCLKNPQEFIETMGGIPGLRPGRYKINGQMTHIEILWLIRSGKQEPVMLRFNRLSGLTQLAGLVGLKLEGDSAEYLRAMLDSALLQKNGMQLSPQELPALYVPNSYEFYWNTDEKAFVERMAKEYKAFWNEERKFKAKALGLTPVQVATLASIVQGEQSRLAEEWGTIGRLYLNRLKADMLLQADPTVKFALGDPGLNRIRYQHLKVEHPYNTYLNKGLPPGPISLVDPAAIDSVLNAPEHSYIYMCAKADFSGRHSFSIDYEEHKRNAEAFRRELDRREGNQ